MNKLAGPSSLEMSGRIAGEHRGGVEAPLPFSSWDNGARGDERGGRSRSGW
jgi:hypothetical protein